MYNIFQCVSANSFTIQTEMLNTLFYLAEIVGSQI